MTFLSPDSFLTVSGSGPEPGGGREGQVNKTGMPGPHPRAGLPTLASERKVMWERSKRTGTEGKPLGRPVERQMGFSTQ